MFVMKNNPITSHRSRVEAFNDCNRYPRDIHLHSITIDFVALGLAENLSHRNEERRNGGSSIHPMMMLGLVFPRTLRARPALRAAAGMAPGLVKVLGVSPLGLVDRREISTLPKTTYVRHSAGWLGGREHEVPAPWS
jgi:hypothetical protein